MVFVRNFVSQLLLHVLGRLQPVFGTRWSICFLFLRVASRAWSTLLKIWRELVAGENCSECQLTRAYSVCTRTTFLMRFRCFSRKMHRQSWQRVAFHMFLYSHNKSIGFLVQFLVSSPVCPFDHLAVLTIWLLRILLSSLNNSDRTPEEEVDERLHSVFIIYI